MRSRLWSYGPGDAAEEQSRDSACARAAARNAVELAVAKLAVFARAFTRLKRLGLLYLFSRITIRKLLKELSQATPWPVTQEQNRSALLSKLPVKKVPCIAACRSGRLGGTLPRTGSFISLPRKDDYAKGRSRRLERSRRR